MATGKKPASSASSAAAKAPDAQPDVPSPAGGEPASGVAARGPSLKIKGLVDQVAAVTGGKKKMVKDVVEATLHALGDALGRGEELNLPGFGRARIARSQERDGASHLTLKVRRGPHKKRDGDDTEPLADEGEDS